MKIAAFLIDGVHQGLITDNPHPFFSFHLESDQEGACLEEAKVVFEDGYELLLPDEVGAAYQGSALKPFSKYKATLHVKDNLGNQASEDLEFETGHMDAPWVGKFITDGQYEFKEKSISPKPMVFKKAIPCEKEVRRVLVFATCFGIYELQLNGEKVGNRYFAPGFTSYEHQCEAIGKKKVFPAPVLLQWTWYALDEKGPVMLYERKGYYIPSTSN